MPKDKRDLGTKGALQRGLQVPSSPAKGNLGGDNFVMSGCFSKPRYVPLVLQVQFELYFALNRRRGPALARSALPT